MDTIKVAEQVARGVSVFCATCIHFWAGRERGEGCGKKCGSPLVGMSFPHYRGMEPVVIRDLARFCFMCGSTPHPEGGVKVPGHDKIFALCALHRSQVKDFQVIGGSQAPAPLIQERGRFVPLELVTLRRRTLVEEMAHNDRLLRERNGEDPGDPSA